MNADELCAMQAPFKARYDEHAEAAMLTLRVTGELDEPAIACKIETGRALVEAGLHRATGGGGLQACSSDMLLEALVACAGVTVCAMATTMGIEVRNGTVSAEGDVDLRGVCFDLDSDADAEQLATLMELTERYCVIYQTLRHPSAAAMRFAAPGQPGMTAMLSSIGPPGVIRGVFGICDSAKSNISSYPGSMENVMALELRPNCECCDVDLPPASAKARICSYECTFCADCAENVLLNVCPNCGGGFVARPIRPVTEWRAGLSLAKRPPSGRRVYLSYSREDLAAHSRRIKDISPQDR